MALHLLNPSQLLLNSLESELINFEGEERRMKKIAIIICAFVTIILIGSLYGTQDQADERKPLTLEQVWGRQCPDPMVDFPLF